jgi:hypothetical protein
MEQSAPLVEPSLMVNRTERQFQPQDIVIVSNGMCGSMCSYTTAWYCSCFLRLIIGFTKCLGFRHSPLEDYQDKKLRQVEELRGIINLWFRWCSDYPMPLANTDGNTDLWSMMTECGMTSDAAMPGKLAYVSANLQVEARNGISYLQPQ